MNDLIEGEDFYYEGELIVFTRRYHLKRGYCCGSGCRHCPYDPKWTQGTTTLMTMSYYEPKDLQRFGEIGKFRAELAEKFFDYYNSVTGSDGALTKREKALIALAVAHSKQCPYCIDAYTTACLESGANPEEMTEAVHVAAVMEAGITLVHSVQMHNALEKLGAM